MAQNAAQVQVTTTVPILLWQTTTAVSPDPITSAMGNSTQQIFMAGTVNDPVPIVIMNNDSANPIYVGPFNVTSTSGVKIPAGGSITRNVVGNDSEFAISTGGTVNTLVEVGRQ
jgi:hypothetical protein